VALGAGLCYNVPILTRGWAVKNAADVAIIGGGIQGINLAYHLAQCGVTDVCVVEMNTLGSRSSGRSAGLAGHALQTENLLPLSVWSYDAFMRFEEELGLSPDLVRTGSLLLAGAVGAPALCQRESRVCVLSSGVDWLALPSEHASREGIRVYPPYILREPMPVAEALAEPRGGRLAPEGSASSPG
jgi:glycine/D-amino acid oxidase-like deaminating enzyme